MELKTKLLTLNCIPLVVFAIVTLIFGVTQFRASIYSERESNLSSVALAALTMYSSKGYGDYDLRYDGNIWRGMNFNISQHTSIVDELKGQTGVDITFFYGEKAIMTSIMQGEEDRCVGLEIDDRIKNFTLKQGSQIWLKDVMINNEHCQAYAIPIRQESNDAVIGALMASQSAAGFNAMIRRYVITTMITTALIIFVVFFFIRWHVDWFYQKFSEVKDKSKQDLLTGLLNKMSFQEEVSKELNRQKKPDEISILLILDFDNFKHVNDNYGHQIGDEALKSFANILLRAFRTQDIVGRIGGDEFMVYMTEMNKKDYKRADEISKEILRELYNLKIGEAEHFSCSIGIGVDGSNYQFQQLYNLADKALYKSKENGKACFTREVSPESNIKEDK